MPSEIRNLDLNLLKVFDAIMEEHNISRAADRLSVSQPAISNALRRLRALYEDELFIRTAKGVVPTSKANEIAIPIREAIRGIGSTLNTDMEFHPEISRRKFTIAMTDYGELYFLPHLMQQLENSAPDIEVVCLPNPGAALTIEMKSGLVDLVWDWKKIDDPHFVANKIFEDKSCCIVRKEHPKIKNNIPLEKFLELEHVVLRPTQTHIPSIERHLESQGFERKVVTEVSHLLVIPAIVATTELVAVIPERLARHFEKQLDIDIYPNPLFAEPVPVYQMWHMHFNNDAGHKWFRELLISLVKIY